MNLSKEELKTIIKESILEATPKATMTIMECAAYSGIGKDKIREMVAKENTDFPHFKVGIKTLIPKEPLDRWLVQVAESKVSL